MNFVQQIGETLRSIDLGSAIGASGFKTVDLVILVVYLVVLVALGLFLGRTKKGEQKSANDYFLAGNTLTWWAVGASLIAANISAEQFIGMSGTGFRDGIATAAYEIMAAVTLIVIGKFLCFPQSNIGFIGQQRHTTRLIVEFFNNGSMSKITHQKVVT